jgi:hypothetical protein
MKDDDVSLEWFDGSHKESFAEAARIAVENAERAFRERGRELPTEYDVQLRVRAHGPLSDYRVFVSPHG